MPYNGSGSFTRTKSWVEDKNNGIKIQSDRHDDHDSDIAAGLSNCITKDGQTTITDDIPWNGNKITGLGNATAATDALNRQAADARYVQIADFDEQLASTNYATTDVASAATCDIGAATTARVRITGTTTITSLGTDTNTLRFVHFEGALTLTHNATSLILPTAANITTAAGDSAIFASDNSGNWRCLLYSRASGKPTKALIAGDVGNTPAGNIAATDVQSALNELDTEKLGLSGGALTGGLTVASGAVRLGDDEGSVELIRADGAYIDFKDDAGDDFDIRIKQNGTALDIITTGGGVTIDSNSVLTADQVASQSEMETATATNRVVTPGRQHFHPGMAKAWGIVTVSGGTPTLAASYNITSITDAGVGALTVTIANDFSSTSYAVIATVQTASSGLSRGVSVESASRAVGSFTLHCNSYNNADTDPEAWFFACYGDL